MPFFAHQRASRRPTFTSGDVEAPSLDEGIKAPLELEYGLGESARAGFTTGTGGFAIGAGLRRPTMSYQDYLTELGDRSLVFRGLEPRPGGGFYDPLKTTGGDYPVAYGSPNPSVAASYAGGGPGQRLRMAERLMEEYGGIPQDPESLPQRAARVVSRDITSRRLGILPQRAGQVAPLWLGTEAAEEFPWRELGHTPEGAMYSRDWNRATMGGPRAPGRRVSGLDPSKVVRATGVVDPGPNWFYETGAAQGFHEVPSGQLSWGAGAASELAGEALSLEEVGDVVRNAASRLGLDPSNPVPQSMQQAVIDEVANDPRFRVSGWKKARGFLGKGLKALVNPIGVLADAGIGGTVNAMAGLGGTWAGSRGIEGGTLRPPGPGYEHALSRADVDRITYEKDLAKERLRGQLIEDVNLGYGAGTLSAGASIEQIREYIPNAPDLASAGRNEAEQALVERQRREAFRARQAEAQAQRREEAGRTRSTEAALQVYGEQEAAPPVELYLGELRDDEIDGMLNDPSISQEDRDTLELELILREGGVREGPLSSRAPGRYERTLTGDSGSLSSALGREYEKVVG